MAVLQPANVHHLLTAISMTRPSGLGTLDAYLRQVLPRDETLGRDLVELLAEIASMVVAVDRERTYPATVALANTQKQAQRRARRDKLFRAFMGTTLDGMK